MHRARHARAAAAVVAVLVSATALGACGAGSSSSARRPLDRTLFPGQTLSCVDGQRVRRDPEGGTFLYECFTPNVAQPVADVPDVQQGDPCPVFGATTYNAQGYVFDCEPWGPDTTLRWILP